MSFDLHHTFVSERITPTREKSGGETFFRVQQEGRFALLYPGRLVRGAVATYTHRVRTDDPDPTEPGGGEKPRPGTSPLHGGFQTATESIRLELKVFTPDGHEFTATEVTLDDLRRYRDLRGTPSGLWSYSLSGDGQHVPLNSKDDIITNPTGFVSIGADESVLSESAPPLVNNATLTGSRQSFAFDLFRVGDFVADLTQTLSPGKPPGLMRLLDPDGIEVARTSGQTLRFPVSLATLGKSRDGAGRPRNWTLEVSPQGGVRGAARRIKKDDPDGGDTVPTPGGGGVTPRVTATVIGAAGSMWRC